MVLVQIRLLLDMYYGVLCPIGIVDAQHRLRIVPPMAVDQETVEVKSFPQTDSRFPGTVRIFMQIDRMLRPARKVPDQLHARRLRRRECECSLLNPAGTSCRWLVYHNLSPSIALHFLNLLSRLQRPGVQGPLRSISCSTLANPFELSFGQRDEQFMFIAHNLHLPGFHRRRKLN